MSLMSLQSAPEFQDGSVSKRIYITFGGQNYDRTTKLIVERAPKNGADEVIVYDDAWLIQQPLFEDPRFQYLYNHKGVGNPNGGRGFGWFAWKPYVMMDALKRCQPGDIVLFTDGDTYPVHDFSMLYEECDRIGGTLLFSAVGCDHIHYCKRDCFIQMGQDEPRFHSVQHAVARFFMFQAGAAGVDDFLAQWLHFCLDPIATTFEPSILGPELKGFIQHRCEQAILTNLAHKYGHKLYREACQFGNSVDADKDLYPQLFEQLYCDRAERRICAEAHLGTHERKHHAR